MIDKTKKEADFRHYFPTPETAQILMKSTDKIQIIEMKTIPDDEIWFVDPKGKTKKVKIEWE